MGEKGFCPPSLSVASVPPLRGLRASVVSLRGDPWVPSSAAARGRLGRVVLALAPVSTVLLDPAAALRGLRRVAGEIAERGRGLDDLAIVGIRRGGEPIARRLAALLGELERRTPPPVGSIDITLYRDDAATALPSPRIGPSHIPFPVSGRRIVLVDDVLYTGRTIRAAVDALLDYGRPRRIELVALVDRGGRELPIQPDYCVLRVADVPPDRHVEVIVESDDADESGAGEAIKAVVVPAAPDAARRAEGPSP